MFFCNVSQIGQQARKKERKEKVKRFAGHFGTKKKKNYVDNSFKQQWNYIRKLMEVLCGQRREITKIFIISAQQSF